MHRNALVVLAAAALMCGSSCAPEPKSEPKKAEAKKPPEPIGGQSAFFRMLGMARTGWALDVQGYKLEPIRLETVADKDGKFGAWRGQFVSTTRRSLRSYTFSIIEGEGLHSNVFAGPEENYAAPRGQNLPFPIQALKIDSTVALQTAIKNSAKYMRTHPNMPVTPILEKTKQFPNPAWRVVWGTSVATSNYSVYVDASTGQYLQTMR